MVPPQEGLVLVGDGGLEYERPMKNRWVCRENDCPCRQGRQGQENVPRMWDQNRI